MDDGEEGTWSESNDDGVIVGKDNKENDDDSVESIGSKIKKLIEYRFDYPKFFISAFYV